MSTFLFDLSQQNLVQFWNGKEHPPQTTALDLFEQKGFRAPAVLHGTFDVVWSIETPISLQGWKILFDELIVLLKAKGKLVIKYPQNEFISIPAVKNYLFRKFGLSVSLSYEEIDVGVSTCVFELEKLYFTTKQKSPWTFGILTQGKKNDIVSRFCRSVREWGGDEHQILICGPQNPAFDSYNVEYMKDVYSSSPNAIICVKKNDIVEQAAHDNIMIIHDRYFLNPDFFSGFDIYGYDFEFLTIRQHHQSEKIYPSLCAIQDNGNLIWGQILHTQNDKELWRQPYVNGGLVIAKKHLLQAIPFNAMIFHNQAEDVELSKEMLKVGVIPKLNSFSSAQTDVPDDLTNAFVLQNTSDYMPLAALQSPSQSLLLGWLTNAAALDFSDRLLLKLCKAMDRVAKAKIVDRVSWCAIASRSFSFVLSRVRQKFLTKKAA